MYFVDLCYTDDVKACVDPCGSNEKVWGSLPPPLADGRSLHALLALSSLAM